MKKLLSSLKYFTYGIQFTFIILAPFVICIFIAGYLQRKYNLGSWIIILSIILAFIFMAADLFSFGRMILKEINKKSGSESIDKQNSKK